MEIQYLPIALVSLNGNKQILYRIHRNLHFSCFHNIRNRRGKKRNEIIQYPRPCAVKRRIRIQRYVYILHLCNVTEDVYRIIIVNREIPRNRQSVTVPSLSLPKVGVVCV